EPRDPGCVTHHVPGFVVHLHLDEHVTWEYLALHGVALAGAYLYLLDGGHFHAEDAVTHIEGLDTVLKVLLDLVLVPGIGMNDVPTPSVIDGLGDLGGLGGCAVRLRRRAGEYGLNRRGRAVLRAGLYLR